MKKEDDIQGDILPEYDFDSMTNPKQGKYHKDYGENHTVKIEKENVSGI